jgi:hypothetical protein
MSAKAGIHAVPKAPCPARLYLRHGLDSLLPLIPESNIWDAGRQKYQNRLKRRGFTHRGVALCGLQLADAEPAEALQMLSICHRPEEGGNDLGEDDSLDAAVIPGVMVFLLTFEQLFCGARRHAPNPQDRQDVCCPMCGLCCGILPALGTSPDSAENLIFNHKI